VKKIYYLIFYLIACLVLIGISRYQDVPGYMDAEYYYITGVKIADGTGLLEPFLWNYLDNPVGLPHPSHSYWMPMASFVMAAGSLITGTFCFGVARIGFILLAAFIAPLSALLAWNIGATKQGVFLVSGLAIFPGFYYAYLSTTDTFGIYMILGSVWCLICASYIKTNFMRRKWIFAFLLGSVTGLMHLSRADGVVWLGVSLTVCFLWSSSDRKLIDYRSRYQLASLLRQLFSISAYILLGYLLIMGLWLFRNRQVFGTFLSPGSALSLWFVDYDDLYIYPSSLITYERWLSTGIKEILRIRWWAFRLNVQTALIVQGGIFLWPLSLIGAWNLRHRMEIIGMSIAWIISFGVMTVIFPFAGARGGFFHSGAAFQPLLWALVPIGLSRFVNWGKIKRGWDTRAAYSVFGFGIILITFVMTVFVGSRRVLGSDIQSKSWGDSYRNYLAIDSYLDSIGVDMNEILMVNNPPGYYLASGKQAIAIPDGDENSLIAAGKRYGASYVILEVNHPQGLHELYDNPGDLIGLEYVNSFLGTRIYQIAYQ
jgi:hypothetical protein